MKKLLLFLLLIVSASNIQAQDVIVKKDGSTVVCRVVEINSSEIVYKKWTDLNGSNYVMNRADASAVNYENGKKENLGEMTNLYAPNNQNTGTQMVNDRALLAIDADTHDLTKKVKTLKTIGWIGGAAFAAFGCILIAADDYDFFGFNSSDETLLGLGFIGLGAAWSTSFLLLSNYQKKKTQMLEMTTIYQYDFNLFGNSSLSACIDMINNRSVGEKNVVFGLRYNF